MQTTEGILSKLEQQICTGDIANARKTLRHWLSLQLPAEQEASSVGDWLKLFAAAPDKYPDVASVLIRCSAVQGLLQPNSANQIHRSLIEITQSNIPKLLAFQKIDAKEQNYLKYKKLSEVHDIALRHLEPIYRPYGDIQVLVDERNKILGVLGHNTLKDYFKYFGLDEVRSDIESIFGALSRIVSVEDSLFDDLEACQASLRDSVLTCERYQTFLTKQCLAPFLENVEKVLQIFLERMSDRFSTTIHLDLDGDELKKRYPLHEEDRELTISLPLRNSGPGRAIDVRITCEDSEDFVQMDSMAIMLGNVAAGEFEVNYACRIVQRCSELNFIIRAEWGEVASTRRYQETFIVQVLAQVPDIPWSELQYSSPYSTEVAEGDAFLGREDKVTQLAGKILRSPMEPFYITGQRRVGKTSLAKASANFACRKAEAFSIHVHYILWGSVASVDAASSVRRLGEGIHAFLAEEMPADIEIPRADFEGSLSDLLPLVRLAAKTVPSKRFLIILDEIDELPSDLYVSGDLASTFFGNLRALSREQNIGLVLVGGENMPYMMDRQGQRLNNFSRVNLSSYDRGSEWSDFQLLVREPTTDLLHWHEEAVSEVYNTTNGNPYFAKLLCANIFDKAVRDRDADITVKEVRTALEAAISGLGANSFVHLWQDGISRPESEREPIILRRLRVLLGLARCLRNRLETTVSNIRDHRATETLLESEIAPTLVEFSNRGIMVEHGSEFNVLLPIFEKWLVDSGAAQIATVGMSEEIASGVMEAENQELVKAAEIVELVEGWPTYRGRRIGTEEVRAWIEQVESKRHQRLLFSLLQRAKVYSETMIRERLRGLHDAFKPSLPDFVITRRREERTDVIVTYLDGAGKSGANYASMYAEEVGIPARLVVPPQLLGRRCGEEAKGGNSIKGVILVDDIVATGRSLERLLRKFVEESGEALKGKVLRVGAVVAAPEGQERAARFIREFGGIDIEFRVGEVLSTTDRAFPSESFGWDSRQRKEEAEALCRDIGSRVYRKSPFGFGGLGLLVVFPTTVPNNSLPILHSPSKQTDKPWKPLFPRLTN